MSAGTIDRRKDPAYEERRIRHIDDAELKSAMDFAGGGDFYSAWAKHWERVREERGWFLGDGDLLMRAGAGGESLEHRRGEILASAEQLLKHNLNGWGDVTIQ